MARRMGRWLWGPGVDVARPWRAAPVSVALLAALIAVFVAERLSGPWQADVTDLRHLLGWSEPEISDGQVWRLVTSGFLHSDESSRFGPFGFEHLVANCALLVVVGPRLEARVRPSTFFGLVLTMQVVAFSAWAWLDTAVYFGVGASGWLSAVAGAVVIDALRHWREERLYAAATLIWITLFLLDPSISTTSEQVHMFGLVGGALFGGLALGDRSHARWERPVVLASMGAVALVPIVWHAVQVEERPAVQYGEPAVELPCSDDPGRPRAASGALEVVNQTDDKVFLAQLTPAGAAPLMVLHPDERIVGGLPVGTRVRLGRADGSCLTVAEVSARSTTLRLRSGGPPRPDRARAQRRGGWASRRR